MAEERSDELKAKNYAAMLDGANVIATIQDPDMEFGNDMTTDEKKERVARSMGYLEWGVGLDDWGDEDMAPINTAIASAKKLIAS